MMSFKSPRNTIRGILLRLNNRRNSPLVSVLAIILLFVSLWSVGSGVVFAFHSITHKKVLVKSVTKQSVKGVRIAQNTEPTVTSTQTPTPSPTPKPTVIPTPNQVSSSTPTPTSNPVTPTPTPGSTSVNLQAYLLSEVNNYRQSQGLSSVQSDSNTCDFAKKRAGELAANFSHDGFSNLPYSSYSKVTENIAMNSDYTKVVSQWIASSLHAENMRADTPFVCIEANGKYYAYEGWKP